MMGQHAATDQDFEFAALDRARFYRRAIAQEFAAALRGRVLEVGAGVGQMTAEFASLPGVTSITAVEPDCRFWPGFRQRLPNMRLVEGSVATLAPGEAYDAAVMVNVLEHIEDDVGQLRLLRQHVVPEGGSLCILVPARPELFSAIDVKFGHYRRYTAPALRKCLTAAGFTIDSLSYFNLVGYLLWYVNFTLRGQTSFNPSLVAVFDRYIFQVCNVLERNLCRPPIGQSIIAIASRP
jgi:SAM-dependent methyltransferase